MARASFCIPRHVPADGHAMTHLVVADLILLPLPFETAWYNFTTTRPMSQPNDNRTWSLEFRTCELMDRNATSIGLSPEIKRDARTERTFSKVFTTVRVIFENIWTANVILSFRSMLRFDFALT